MIIITQELLIRSFIHVNMIIYICTVFPGISTNPHVVATYFSQSQLVKGTAPQTVAVWQAVPA